MSLHTEIEPHEDEPALACVEEFKLWASPADAVNSAEEEPHGGVPAESVAAA